MAVTVDPRLEKMLVHLFSVRGMVSDATLRKIITPETLIRFQIAFTHWSADQENNYEMYEHLGDPIVNAFLSNYIHKRFPEIKNVGYHSKLWAKLKGSKDLGQISQKHFGPSKGEPSYVRYSDAWIEYIKKENPHLETNEKYIGLYEDAIESFCGCSMEVMEGVGISYGAAITVIFDILRTFFDAEEISIRFEDVVDPVTRVKELFTSEKYRFRWGQRDAAYYTERNKQRIAGKAPPMNDYQVVEKVSDTEEKYRAIVWGWPLGNKTMIPKNEMVLADVTDYGKSHTKARAHLQALQTLARYGINDEPVDYTIPTKKVIRAK